MDGVKVIGASKEYRVETENVGNFDGLTLGL